MMLADNIQKILTNMANARNRGTYSAESVRLLAVSKTHPVEIVRQAYEAGLRCFGENRVMEMISKASKLPDDIEWHLIGHLQRNKVKEAVQVAAYVHSIDSLELLKRVNDVAAASAKCPKLLLEVNISGEESKFGFVPEQVENALMAGKDWHCPIIGLMTMAPFGASENELHRIFGALRQLRDELSVKSGLPLPELSMGMSGDFEVAIEEGATIVRVGTAIFGTR